MDTTVRHKNNCSPFSPAELAKFRVLLAEQRAAMMKNCEGLSDAARRTVGDAAGDVSDDTGDLAAEACDQDLSLNFLARSQDELKEIAEALERIERRSYGVCDDCDQPIPAARLEAIPTARLCVPCKSKSEAA